METPRVTGADPVRLGPAQRSRLYEHELRLCASAVALVAGGGAPRVWLVGMRSGQELITRALRMGVATGLLVRARWWPDEEAFDLLVQRRG